MQRNSITITGKYDRPYHAPKNYCLVCGKPFNVAANQEYAYTMLYSSTEQPRCLGFFCTAPDCQQEANGLQIRELIYASLQTLPVPTLEQQLAAVEADLAN